jgi:peptidoglycan/LPS O-acetylase OafA/YrhL
MTARTQVDAQRETGPSGARLGFLDALRGVAVLLVLAQHVGQQLFPAVHVLTQSGLQLGQLGVMVFFLCSGFIIPASLERGRRGEGRVRQLTRFWRSRFFRLFPLYWLSLGAALLLGLGGIYRPPSPLTARDWLLNVTMAQRMLGAPNAVVVYWTLAFELLFYLGLSVLFLLGWHRHSVALSLAASAGCLLVAATSGPLLHQPAPTGLFCLATMLVGTVFHRWYSGEVRLPWLVTCTLSTAVGGVAVLLSGLRAGWPTTTPDAPRFAAMLTAWLGAYVVFSAGVALRRRRPPAWLLRLGAISYSVYLMQELVLAAVPALAHPVLTAVACIAATMAVSELTYRFVERPAVRLGRRLAPSAAAHDAAGAVRRPISRARASAGVPAPRPAAPSREVSAA